MFWIIIFSYLIHFSTQDCIGKSYGDGECIRRSHYGSCVERKKIYELTCIHSNGVFTAVDFHHEIGKLSVTASNLSHIRSISFKHLKSLETLVMNDDNIETIENGAFDELQRLETLNLANNNLTALNRLFLLETNVKDLDLSNNTISEIDESALKLTKDLKLILRKNKIKTVAFLKTNCEQLSSLDLSQNSIDKFVFLDVCANLTYLNISKNNLKEFYTNVSSSTRLKTLDLSFNNLTSIDSDALAYFDDLEVLNLDHNQLFAVNDIPIGLFRNNQNLKRLILANTGIKILKIGTFAKLGNLIELDLSSNNLNDLQNGLFHGLKNWFTHLDLSNNRLTRFNFSELGSLNLINLNNNLWNCGILSDICKELTKKGIRFVYGNTFDTENLFGIHCTASNEDKIKIKLTRNFSNINLDNLTEYLENVLEKQQNVFKQVMIGDRDFSETFRKDVSHGYKDLFGNIQKNTEEALDKVANSLDAIHDGSQNINNQIKAAINDMNAVQGNYSKTYWKNFNIVHQNIFKNIEDNLGKIFNQFISFKKGTSLEDDLQNNNDERAKFLLIGVYGILLLTILLSFIIILSIYKLSRDRKCENVESSSLASAPL